MQSGIIAPVLSISEDFVPEEIEVDVLVSDTIKVSDAQGREMIIMKAVKDEDGEMVATDVIAPVVVSATFRNVAERHGEVDLCFDVTVPADMVESRWQLRLRRAGCFQTLFILLPSLLQDRNIAGRSFAVIKGTGVFWTVLFWTPLSL